MPNTMKRKHKQIVAHILTTARAEESARAARSERSKRAAATRRAKRLQASAERMESHGGDSMRDTVGA